jgi:hypothetical protein
MTPLTAIAIPAATAAATQLVQQIAAQRPFASFFGRTDEGLAANIGESLNHIGSGIGDLMGELQSAISRQLEAAGLDPATSFDLSSDSGGRLVVGDHPLRSQIEAALAGDDSIRSKFQQISSLQSLLDAAQRHLEFAERYALDPLTALPGRDAKAPFALQFTSGELLPG